MMTKRKEREKYNINKYIFIKLHYNVRIYFHEESTIIQPFSKKGKGDKKEKKKK